MKIAGSINQGADGAGDHGRRLALFSGVGLANTLTDFLVYAGLVAAGVFAPAANVAAFFAANAQSYLVNARVTFRKAGGPAAISPLGYAKFLGAHIVSLILSTAMIVAFADAIGPIAAKLASFVFTLAWNYATSALFVFKTHAGAEESRKTP
jgi:putative flippase GtrA